MNVLTSIIPIFILILVGFYIKKRKIVTSETINQIQNLCIRVFLPALLLLTFSENVYSWKMIVIPIIYIGICFLMYFGTLALKKIWHIDAPYFIAITSLFETGMVGYALFPYIFPNMPLSDLAILDLPQAFYGFLFVFPILSAFYSDSKKKVPIKEKMVGFVKNPIIISIVLGMLISISGVLKINVEVEKISNLIVSTIAAPLGALILISIGYELDIKIKVVKQALKLVLSKSIVALIGGVIFILIMKFVFHMGRDNLFVYAFWFTLPASFLTPNFIRVEENKKICSTAISISTVLTLVLFVLFKIVY